MTRAEKASSYDLALVCLRCVAQDVAVDAVLHRHWGSIWLNERKHYLRGILAGLYHLTGLQLDAASAFGAAAWEMGEGDHG